MDIFLKDKNFLALLQNLGFKQRGESLYLITPIVLNNTNNLLVVYCRIKKEEIVLSDNAQIIDAYDAPNVDFEHLKKCILAYIKKSGVNYDRSCLVKKVSKNNFVNELSCFIKFLVILEKHLEINL